MHSLMKLVKIIKNNRRIAIATHIDPDCDGISAVLACAHLVKHYKPQKPILFCDSPIPTKYNLLLRRWKFTKKISDFDLLIVVDSAGISRVLPDLGDNMLAKLKSQMIVNIDHHRSNDSFGQLQIIDEHASSTCEMIYEIFRKLRIKIDQLLAEIFYCGIYSETGGFAYPNTTNKVFKIASDLVRLGIKPSSLVKKLNAKTLGGTLLLSKVLNTIEIKDGVGIMYLTQNMLKRSRAEMPDSENFISFLQAIKAVRVSFFLREEKGGTRISLRSDGIVDVDKLAAKYGGGGHRLAAGIKVKKDLNAAKQEILSDILKELKRRA